MTNPFSADPAPDARRRSGRRIRLREVMRLVPLGRSTIYDRMKAGTFPKSYDLGGGVVCWRKSDILDWLDALPEKAPVKDSETSA